MRKTLTDVMKQGIATLAARIDFEAAMLRCSRFLAVPVFLRNAFRGSSLNRTNWGGDRGGHGLNGPRAVARRKRQIAAGSLRAENGLVV